MAGVDLAGKRAAPAPPPAAPLSIDAAETTEVRMERLITENPVVIFSRSSCCICHVMKRLLCTIGTHPTVIELDDGEMDRAAAALGLPPAADGVAAAPSPAVFIGGVLIGGLESLMALHLSGLLVPRLREVGALLR